MNPLEIIVRTTQEIAADDTNVKAYKERATTLKQMFQLDDALNDLNTIIDKLNVADAEALQMRGEIKMQKGDKNGALEDIKRAMTICPEILKQFEGKF